MYSTFAKCYKIAQYAHYTYGDKITLEQLKTSITMIMQTPEARTIDKYIDYVQRDFSPVCTPQIKKLPDGTFEVTVNMPKSPNIVIGDASVKGE